MAYPITHIVLSQKVYNKYFKDKDRKKFFVGTSFPDIRTLAHFKRERTHYKNLVIEDITSEDSFMVGVKFHSYVDEERERYLKKSVVFKLFPKSEYLIHGLKFLEDQLLYEEIDNWAEYVGYFNDVLDEELNFGTSRQEVEKWHEILRTYLRNKPDHNRLVKMQSVIGRSKEFSDGIIDLVRKLGRDEGVIRYVSELYDDFE